MKITNDGGEEIEVFTAEEVTAREAGVRTAVEGEYKPKLDAAEAEKIRLDGLLKSRAQEFAGFRELNEEQVSQLAEKDRIIYENQLAIKKAEDLRVAGIETAHKTAVAAAIDARAGGNAKLKEEMEKMWGLIGIEAQTPEQIESKVLVVLGALSTSSPDLMASVNGFQGGSFAPPKAPGSGDKSFADSDAGKAGAAELGLMVEAPKK